MLRAYELHGVGILECATDGPPPRSVRDATDLVSAAWEHKAKMVVLPADWLGDDFFRLGTRIAGEVTQKLLDYRIRVAIVGDISGRQVESQALQDWVGECNRGRHVWFAATLEELGERLSPA